MLKRKEKGQPNSWMNYTEFIGVSQDISGCRTRLLPLFSKTYFSEVLWLLWKLCMELGCRTLEKVSESDPVVLSFSLSVLHPKLLTGLHFHWNSRRRSKATTANMFPDNEIKRT